MLGKLLFNTFKIDANVKSAKVTYIVDPYDRTKDIVCYTPCKIKIPWEPHRKRANKAKILVEKEGYQPKVVEFTRDWKFIIITLLSAIILVYIAGMFHIKFGIPGYTLAFIGIIIGANLSVGSGDIYVELEPIISKKEK